MYQNVKQFANIFNRQLVTSGTDVDVAIQKYLPKMVACLTVYESSSNWTSCSLRPTLLYEIQNFIFKQYHKIGK